jgi:hypothetical protein
MALNFDDDKCDLLILRTGKVLKLLFIKDELLSFCEKYNTIPLFAYDFGTNIMFNEDKTFADLQDISTVGITFMKNYDLNINECIGFRVTTYGEAVKIYQNINELSIFNDQLSIKINGNDDTKHFKTKDSKEITYIRLYPI